MLCMANCTSSGMEDPNASGFLIQPPITEFGIRQAGTPDFNEVQLLVGYLKLMIGKRE